MRHFLFWNKYLGMRLAHKYNVVKSKPNKKIIDTTPLVLFLQPLESIAGRVLVELVLPLLHNR